MVMQVSCGPTSSLVLCDDGKETFLVGMGQSKILTEKYADDETINQITEDELFKVQDINSLPFSIDFFIPIVKVTCGDQFSALLTAEGEVFTWGTN